MVTGHTRREARFTDDERETWIALWEYDQETCPDCGNQRSVCSDPDTDWYPQRSVCWATASQENVTRRWEGLQPEDPKPDAAGYLPSDGLRLWVSREDLTPDDDFLAPPPTDLSVLLPKPEQYKRDDGDGEDEQDLPDGV